MIYTPNWAGKGMGVGLETRVGRAPMTMWWPYRNRPHPMGQASFPSHAAPAPPPPLLWEATRPHPISRNHVHSEWTIMCSFNFGGSFGGPPTCAASFFASRSRSLWPGLLRGGTGCGLCHSAHAPRSHQTFRLVPAVKLLGIVLRDRCWLTAFHTITAGDGDGWCQEWLV